MNSKTDVNSVRPLLGNKRRLNAKEISRDIRMGMNDTELMEKYQLTMDKLPLVFKLLVDKGILDQRDLDERKSHQKVLERPNIAKNPEIEQGARSVPGLPSPNAQVSAPNATDEPANTSVNRNRGKAVNVLFAAMPTFIVIFVVIPVTWAFMRADSHLTGIIWRSAIFGAILYYILYKFQGHTELVNSRYPGSSFPIEIKTKILTLMGFIYISEEDSRQHEFVVDSSSSEDLIGNRWKAECRGNWEPSSNIMSDRIFAHKRATIVGTVWIPDFKLDDTVSIQGHIEGPAQVPIRDPRIPEKITMHSKLFASEFTTHSKMIESHPLDFRVIPSSMVKKDFLLSKYYLFHFLGWAALAVITWLT